MCTSTTWLNTMLTYVTIEAGHSHELYMMPRNSLSQSVAVTAAI